MNNASAVTSASPDRLWDLVSDVEQWGRRLPTFTSVDYLSGPQPTAVGTSFSVRQPGLPRATYQVTQWEPGVRFVWEARTPGLCSRGDHQISVEESASEPSSRLSLAFEWSGLLAPLLRAVGSK